MSVLHNGAPAPSTASPVAASNNYLTRLNIEDSRNFSTDHYMIVATFLELPAQTDDNQYLRGRKCFPLLEHTLVARILWSSTLSPDHRVSPPHGPLSFLLL